MKNIVIYLIVFSLAACSKDNKSQVDVTETVQTQLDVSKDKVLTFLKNKAIRNFNFKKGTSTLYFASSNYESGIDLNKAEIDSRIDSFRGEHSLVLKCATRSKCGYGATFNSNNRKSVANAKKQYFDSYLVHFRSIRDVKEFKKILLSSDFSGELTRYSLEEEFGDRSNYSDRKWEKEHASELARKYKKILRNEDGSLAVLCSNGSSGTITQPKLSICIMGNDRSDCKPKSEWLIGDAANKVCGS